MQKVFKEGKLKREDVFIATKLWNNNHRPERVKPAFEASLKRLQLDYVDLYLIHTPFAFQPGDEQDPRDENGKVIYDDGVTLLDTWGALESLVDEGRSKAVYGVGLKSFRFTGIGRGRSASGKMTRLETGFGQMLDRFVECFREGDCRRPFPSLREAMTGLEEGMRKTRDTGLLSQQDLDRIRHIMEITNRYQSMADALEECSSVMQSLKLHRYTGDCAL